MFKQPIYVAGRRGAPAFRSTSIGGNAARDVDGVVRTVEARLEAEQTVGDQDLLDGTRSGDRSATSRAISPRPRRCKLVGDDRWPSTPTIATRLVGAAIRAGRALDSDISGSRSRWSSTTPAMGEVVRRLDITGVGRRAVVHVAVRRALIDAVRMVQLTS